MGVLWGWRELTPAGIQRDSLKSGKGEKDEETKKGGPFASH